MIRKEIINFLKYRYLKNPDRYILYQTSQDNDLLRAKLFILRIAGLNKNFTINNKPTIIFTDDFGETIESSCILDRDCKIGDRCLVPLSYKSYGQLGYLPVTAVGYYKLYNGPIDIIDKKELISISHVINHEKRNLIRITDRFIIEAIT